MNRERLKTLSDFLRTVPPERFNMHTWAHSYNIHDSAEDIARELQVEKKCDTTACALGWATAIPEFSKAGLRLEPNSYGDAIVGLKDFVRPSDVGEHRQSFLVGAKFFDIINYQAERLFDPQHYVPEEDVYGHDLPIEPRHVADRIDSLLAGGDA